MRATTLPPPPLRARVVHLTPLDLTLTSPCVARSRLTFEMFLESLLALAVKKFPDEPPIEALALLMSRNVLGLVSNDPDEYEESAQAVLDELKAPPQLPPGVSLESAEAPLA